MIAPLAKYFHRRWYTSCQRRVEDKVAKDVALQKRVINIGADGSSLAFLESCDGRTSFIDFNTDDLPFDDNYADTTVCEQVIEHLHNVRWFCQELRRVTRPGGRLILTTECLNSLPNIMALILGKAPFSTQPLDGYYTDGWQDGPIPTNGMSLNNPIRSGVTGHVRVMTSGQLLSVLKWAGWEVMNTRSWGFGYFVLVQARSRE